MSCLGRRAELHITKGLLDVGRKSLRIAEKILLNHDLCVFCGPYVGPAVFGIEALAAVQDYRTPPRCTQSLMSLHAPEVSDDGSWSNILGRVSLSDIVELVERVGHELSSDQISFFEELFAKSDRCFQRVEAAPGASKTYTATKLAAAILSKMLDSQVWVWATPNRGQANRQLAVFRSCVADPSQVAAFGRAAFSDTREDLGTMRSWLKVFRVKLSAAELMSLKS